MEIFKVNPQRNSNDVVPTFSSLSKQKIYHLIRKFSVHVSIARLKQMSRKGLMEGLPTHLPGLEDPCPICLLNKENKIPRGPTIDDSRFPLGSCFICILRFSMLKVSMGLPQFL